MREGKHEDIGAREYFRQLRAEFLAEEMRVAIRALQAPARGPVADNDFRTGKIEIKKGFEVLLDRYAPDIEKIGRGRSRLEVLRGRNRPWSTPRVHSATREKPRRSSSAFIDGVGASIVGRGMEAPQIGVAPGQRAPAAAPRHILGKRV